MFLFVEWKDISVLVVIFGMVPWHVAWVINYDVNHDEDPPLVSCPHKTLQVFLGTPNVMMFLKVLRPVAVIAVTVMLIIKVFNNRRYPNGIKTHALDVVQILFNSFPCATTVLFQVPALRIHQRTTIRWRKPVSEHLIDRAWVPRLCSFRVDTW